MKNLKEWLTLALNTKKICTVSYSDIVKLGSIGDLDSQSSQEVMGLLTLVNKQKKIALQADRIITIGDGKIINDEVVK